MEEQRWSTPHIIRCYCPNVIPVCPVCEPTAWGLVLTQPSLKHTGGNRTHLSTCAKNTCAKQPTVRNHHFSFSSA